MRGKNWISVADEQFRSMPQDFRKDWKDLREKVYS